MGITSDVPFMYPYIIKIFDCLIVFVIIIGCSSKPR